MSLITGTLAACLLVTVAQIGDLLPPDPRALTTHPAISAWFPPSQPEGCVTSGCHEDYGKHRMHIPGDEETCLKCHVVVDGEKHRVELTAQQPELCNNCHAGVLSGMVFLHGPVAAGTCTVCHDPHGSPHPGLLIKESKDLCLACHKVLKGQPFQHGPVASGDCTICHDPHGAGYPKLLVGKPNVVCLGCHTTIKKRMETSEFVHPPAKDSCVNCHDPHSANNRLNLHKPLPALCLECHDNIAKALESSVKHDGILQERTCLNCHDPHAAPHQKGLLQAPIDLCLTCHDKPVKSDDKMLMNMKEHLAANTQLHGPIRQGRCTDCHQSIHGGNRFRLLKDSYPPEFYAPFDLKSYGLCFQCHEPALVKDAKTASLTRFRNGTRNLHFLHVNRKVKGRTCRACHETHASRQPLHIRSSVPFGTMGWNYPITFSKTVTGGSCQPGCHKRYSYDRVEPVTNIPPILK